jgi:hypothetical protein
MKETPTLWVNDRLVAGVFGGSKLFNQGEHLRAWLHVVVISTPTPGGNGMLTRLFGLFTHRHGLFALLAWRRHYALLRLHFVALAVIIGAISEEGRAPTRLLLRGQNIQSGFLPCGSAQKKLTSFFDLAKICEKSGKSSSELNSTMSAGGGRRCATLDVATLDVDAEGTDNKGFLSRAGRERSFSERVNARSSSCVGSKALERKMAFGLMSFIFLHTGPV